MLLAQLSFAQVSDDFTDGDFTNNPAWAGDVANFDASSNQLRLNVTPAGEGESYISTPQSELGQTTWEFYFRLAFSPSGNNRVRIFLVANSADLGSYPDGYFFEVGESGTSDVLRFYKRDGGTNTLLFSGSTALSSSFELWVQVTRDIDGNWQVSSNNDGLSAYASEGASFNDTTHPTSSYFGFWCDYTSSNSTNFYFDDISISTTPVIPSFAAASLAKEGNNAIRVTFNQNVDEVSGETLSNYTLDYGFGNPIAAERHATNLDEVLLTFSNDFVNNDYSLQIDQVENEAKDEIISAQNLSFEVEIQTPFREVVINELMADPTPVVGLPDAEYIELYNNSDQSINLGGFEFDGETLDDFVIGANEYVTLTDDANVGLFSGEVLGVNISLTNSGKALELLDNLGNLVDSVSYSTDWYQDSDKDDGGYSLEQINPELACSYQNNWIVSASTNGGTPGTQNAVFDNSPDTQGPNLTGFVSTDANTFRLTFDEPMDETSLNGASYSFDHGLTKNGITPISPGYFTALVDVTPDLTSGTTYTITISGATDCAGNPLATNSLSFSYDTNPPEFERIVVKSLNEIDLVFNEALAQIAAETESNYSSSHTTDSPTSAQLDESNLALLHLTFAEEFTSGIENTLTIENIEDTQGNALVSALTPTFTYTQNVDSVYVIGVNLLDIHFSEKPEAASATNTDNYLVNDEVGHPSNAFVDSENDRVIHLAFAKNFDDNKELTLTIQDIKDNSDEYLTTPELTFTYDTAPPKLDTLYVTSAKTLEIVFTEKVEAQSAQSKENYAYDDIYPVNAQLDADQKTVFLEYKNEFEREVVFELIIDEVKDLYGNEISTRIREDFVYDVFGPELDSIIVKSANELVLWFNENLDQSTAENVANYSVGGDTPSLATLDLEFPYLVYLDLPGDLPEVSGIALEISALEDQRQNALSAPLATTFDFDQFYLSNIIPLSQNSVQIEFNKLPDANTKTIISNYQINDQPISTINFTADRIATISFASALQDKSENTLTLQNISDENSSPLGVFNYTFGFDSRLLGSSLVGDRTMALTFEVGLDPAQDLPTTNFSAAPTLGACVAAVIDNENPSILRLTFEQAMAADTPYAIAWQNLTNEYGNALPDYFTTAIRDTTPPTFVDISIIDDNSIWLQFSEPLNEGSAEFLLNYTVTPDIGSPTLAQYAEADSSVILHFPSSFVEAVNYTLTIDNLEDPADNALFDFDLAFTYQAPPLPDFGDLIITEIMADPSPSVGLPEVEYLEIYNTTAEEISLFGLILIDANSFTILTEGSIAPNEYLVLTTSSGAAQLDGVNVQAVSGFPSLNNSGENISLYYGSSQIFSTSYSSEWYKDSDKSNGGWSLEMIDTSNPCGEKSNWSASTDPAGGTPGRANATQTSNPDNFGPQLIQALAITADSLHLSLNEKLHPHSFEQAVISLDPELDIAAKHLFHPIFNKVAVSLATPINAGQLYEITLTQVADCQHNIMSTEHQSARFQLPEEAESQDIVINEVLFNPRTDEVDFVEIYNASDKAIDLKDWKLADKVSDLKTISADHFILYPSEYLALTPDADILRLAYTHSDHSRMFTMSSFPSLADSEDSVLLISDQGLFIDQMEYKDDYHFNLLDDDEGVSLERIAFDAESTNPDSWKSAASTVGFATPGIENSQTKSASQSSATISIEPKVFIPDNSGMNDYTTINYQLDQSGNFANVNVYSVNSVLIKTLAEGELLSTSGFFTWDGTANNGSQATVGYYLVLFEIFDGQGNKTLKKETVVLGARF